nr:MAG TPA: hypothetical protein [Caudoviricetes sp.]
MKLFNSIHHLFFCVPSIKPTKLDVCMLRGIRRNFMPIKLSLSRLLDGLSTLSF